MSGPNMPETNWRATAEHVASKLRRCEAILRRAYRKHHMDDPEIGSNELSDEMANYLADTMGDREFQRWMKDPASRP